jgi:DNA-binding PadR family transcriptional regulator
MNFSQDLIRGSITPIVLSLLRDRPMYGYEMVKQVHARTGGQLEWKEGTLYPALHRLESDGLVKAAWREVEDTGRKRKYYALTGKGRRELAARTNEWQQFTQAVDAILSVGGAA